eukprot:351574-Chlamydomonas_euryale.AAC.2
MYVWCCGGGGIVVVVDRSGGGGRVDGMPSTCEVGASVRVSACVFRKGLGGQGGFWQMQANCWTLGTCVTQHNRNSAQQELGATGTRYNRDSVQQELSATGTWCNRSSSRRNGSAAIRPVPNQLIS